MSNTTNNNNRSKNTLLLLVGAIVGAAGTYYLHTPQGKKLTKRAIEGSKKISEEVAEKAQHITHVAKEKASAVVTQASESLATAKSAMTDTTVNLLDKAETKVGGFQEGINKAKESMKNGLQS